MEATVEKSYEVCEGFVFRRPEPKPEVRTVTAQEMANGIRLATERELAWTLRQA